MTTMNASFQVILDTTEALVKEKGCRQTTLQDIIARSGLSKGAIYHYVSGKDELLGLVLKARIEQIDVKFREAVSDPAAQGLGNPLQVIAGRLAETSDPEDASNKIFIYLLSQMDNAKVAETMKDVYAYTLNTCTRWIEVGQQHGVIPATVDTRKAAESMLLYMYALRVQSTILQASIPLNPKDLMQFMTRHLQ